MNSSHINKILTAACIAASALAVTACSDGFFDRYPSDSMQMETYLTNDSEAENILLDAYYYLRTVQEDVIMVNGLCTDEAYDYKKTTRPTTSASTKERGTLPRPPSTPSGPTATA